MKLKKLILKNFRAYKDTFEITFDDFTSIIGRNDIGKSSLFEALDMFFNDSKLDESDLNIDAEDKIIQMSCVFSDYPTEIDIDAGYKTNLKQECLLDKNDCLQIVKTYNTELARIKPQTYLRAVHPVEPKEVAELMKLKNADLKALLNQIGINPDVDKKVNAEIREAIRKHFDQSIKKEEILVEVDKEDSKKIMEKLKEELPLFALFKSDRTNSDKESEIQDPISLATKKAIEKELLELQELQRRVTEKVKEVSDRTIAELKNINEGLADKLTLKLEEPSWEKLFKFSLKDENEIPINKRGSGVRRLILLSFFKAEIEHKRQNVDKDKPVIYAIEEPETSQHPDFQQIILELLQGMADFDGNQVFITTHSPNFMNYLPINNVRYLYNDSISKGLVKVCDGNLCVENLYNTIFRDLGVMRNDKVKLIILIEGFSDEDYIRHFSEIYSKKYPEIKNLNTRQDIAFLPFGGGSIKHWAERKYLDSFYPNTTYKFFICDGDVGNYASYSKSILANHTGESFILKKETIENYIPPSAIVKHHEYLGLNITSMVLNADVPKLANLLAKTFYEYNTVSGRWDQLSDNNKKDKISRAKKNIREKILPTTTVDDIESGDEGEIKDLLLKISVQLD